MDKDERLYGLEDWERLECDLEAALERVVDEGCTQLGQPFDELAKNITWPIRILEFKRRDVGGEKTASSIAALALEAALETLDKEYADPDGEATEPTKAMREAALAFGRVVAAGYVPWTAEPTGEVIEYTREQVRRLEASCDEGRA